MFLILFYLIMKTNREGQQFNQYQQNKQGGSTVQLISTKQTITSHHKSLNIKKITIYDVENQSPGLVQT